MFSQLLTKQEQMIYQRLKNGSYAIDYFSKVTLSPFDQTIDEKLFPWLVESHNQRTSITMTLTHHPYKCSIAMLLYCKKILIFSYVGI